MCFSKQLFLSISHNSKENTGAGVSFLYSQWEICYCNDVGVTSLSISPWHCWYIINETHDDVNLRCNLSINECYITKMASTKQQVDDTKGRNINYMLWIEWQGVYISFIISFIKLWFIFHEINKFLSSKLPNFTAKLTIHYEKKIFVITNDNKTMQM